MDAESRDQDAWRQICLVVIVALVFATMVLGGWFNRAFLLPDPASWEQGTLISGAYDPPQEPVELYMNQGDGQLFAHQAQDPFIRHPEGIRGAPAEQAYRLQRPLYGWIGWVASGGQPEAVAWALVAVTMLSVALLAGVVAVASHSFGRSPFWGLVMIAVPGSAVNLLWCGPEALGAAVAGIGLMAWLRRDRRTGLAVACFAVACLTRETFAIVPLTLAAVELWGGRRSGIGTMARQLFRSPLLLSVIPYVSWVFLLRVGLGAWPQGTVDHRLSLIPFGGLVSTLGSAGFEEYAAISVILLTAVAALVFGRDLRLRALVATHLLLAAVLGEAVWETWLAFGRVLLPLSLVSVFALLAPRPSTPFEHGARAMGPIGSAKREGAVVPVPGRTRAPIPERSGR